MVNVSAQPLPAAIARSCLATRCFPRCFTKTHATSIKVPAQRSHAFCTPCQLRLSREETTVDKEINYSNILGDLASGAIANAYYPSQDRGAGLVARSALIGVGGRMALGVVQEFVLRKWTSQHSN